MFLVKWLASVNEFNAPFKEFSVFGLTRRVLDAAATLVAFYSYFRHNRIINIFHHLFMGKSKPEIVEITR